MLTKICSKCKEEKEVCEFYKNNKNPNLYRTHCKKCMRINSQQYKKINKDKVNKKNKEYQYKNAELNKIKSQEYKIKNPEHFKNWVNKNQEHRKRYIKNYNLKSINRFKNSIRSRVNEIMNRKYNNPKTTDLLGCDYNFLITYIENKFKDGMSWDNYGYYGWHIDHIIPLSSAKTEEEICELYHYTNLQPLWAEDNLKKSNKKLV